MWPVVLLPLWAAAQDTDTPLDTAPLEARRVDMAHTGSAVDDGRPASEESFFRFDPHARSRGRVVGTADVVLACAGAGPLRDTALACPLDHQLALRGLPGLLSACTAVGEGDKLPTTATPVPHAATIHAAADARAASAARMVSDCSFQVAASRSGPQLQVAVPAASGAVEIRVGWREQAIRPIPGSPPPEVTWLPPVYQPTVPHKVEDIARTVDLGALRPDRGWWRFDLAVEVLDAAGAATRVIMPVDVNVVGMPGKVELGPSLEVSVGTGAGNLQLADLPIPPQPERSVGLTRGRPGSDRTPRAGGGDDSRAVETILEACLEAPTGLTAGTCRRMERPAAAGGYDWPAAGSGPILGAAARDDLIALPRRMGERVLAQQAALPVDQRSWLTVDSATVLAALGGMLEAMVSGADPTASLAAWARQRPPVLATGESMGFVQDATHAYAPLGSTLYMASLVAASAPDPAPGGPQVGVTALALASNLAWTDNLPGGLRAPWTGTHHPKIGAADLGWLADVAQALDDVRAGVAPEWEALRRSPQASIPALAALYDQTMGALLSASALVPDQSGADLEARSRRRADLDRLVGRLPDLLVRTARGDVAGTADAALTLADDPALRQGLPALTRADMARIGALAHLADPDAPSTIDNSTGSGFVGVLGLGVGATVTGGQSGTAAWPVAALAWQKRIRNGRHQWDLRLPMVDAGAPFAWELTTGEVPENIDWRRTFAPGAQLGWAPHGSTLSWTAEVRAMPMATEEDAVGRLVVGLGLSRALTP